MSGKFKQIELQDTKEVLIEFTNDFIWVIVNGLPILRITNYGTLDIENKKTRPKVEINLTQLKQLRESGCSIKQISETMGVGRGVVYERLKELGLSTASDEGIRNRENDCRLVPKLTLPQEFISHPFVPTPNNGPCASCGEKRSNIKLGKT